MTIIGLILIFVYFSLNLYNCPLCSNVNLVKGTVVEHIKVEHPEWKKELRGGSPEF